MQSDSSLPVRWFLVFLISVWVAAGIGMSTLRWDTSVEALLQQFDYEYKDNKLEEQRAGLNKWLILGYCSLALLGVAGILKTGGKTLSKIDISLLFPLLLWGWCAVTLLWSVEPSLTIRRIAHLYMAIMGGLGITLFLRRREVAWSVLFTMTYLVLVGLLAEVMQGTFTPWRSYYRFSGVGHSNETGMFCAVAILSARMLLLFHKDSKQPFFSERNIAIAFMVLAFGFLILTKSRTTLLSLIIALLLLQVAIARSAGAWVTLTGLVASASFFGLLLASAPTSIVQKFVGVATVGRSAHVSSLTGRLPLWEEIIRDWELKPMGGYGYGAYWTTKRVEDFAQMFHWEPPNGHSIYIDALVETGPVGLGLLIMTLGVTFVIGLQYYRRSHDVAALFTVAIACLAIIHGLAESSFFKGCVGPLLLSTAVFFVWQNRIGATSRRPRWSPETRPRTSTLEPTLQPPGQG
jgi:O-antigen ligase